MSETETEALLEANERFYSAMRDGDLAAMDGLWSHGRRISCTHPNSPAIFGRAAVMESWRTILEDHDPPQVHARAPRAIVTGRTALVLCREDLGHVELMASNAFVFENGGWRMVNHQAAHIPGSERF
jgi:hypothetical protein